MGKVAQAMRETRLALNLSQDQFANALRVSRFTVNQIERGHRGCSPEMAVRLEFIVAANFTNGRFRRSAEEWMNLHRDDVLVVARAAFVNTEFG